MKVLTILIMLWLCLFAANGEAQIVLDLMPIEQEAALGQAVTYSAAISNTGTVEIFLNGDALNLTGAGLHVDDSAFIANAPASLLPNETWAGDVFSVQVDPDTFPSIYVGTLTLLGGTDVFSQDELASQNFQLTVEAAVPEPGSFFWVWLAS